MKSKALGIVVKRYCRRNGIEIKELAAELGINFQNFSRALSGARPLPDEYIEKLAQITGYDLKYLRYLTGQMPEASVACTEEVFLEAYLAFSQVIKKQDLF